ncbi:MAG: hypothetical protein ACJASY_001179 [Halioglobus sp.]|jgi:hypothetical protein
MFSANQVSTQIKQIVDGGMNTQKTLSLSDRLESRHPPLSNPGRLM